MNESSSSMTSPDCADSRRERFRTFYARNPHPAYVRVKGVARWTDLPAYATEIQLTLGDVEDIAAFAETLKKEK